jgi:O-antigen/teichoic acid export membrane protein
LSNKFLFGVSSSWVRLAAVAAIQILLTPLLFKTLPSIELGVWYLFFTVATFISLSDLGLPASYFRAVAYIWGGTDSASAANAPDDIVAFYGRSSIGTLNRSANLAIFLFGGIISLLGYFLAHGYFSRVITDADLLARTSQALAIFLVGVVFNISAAIPYATMNGVGDVGWENVATVIVQLLGYVLTLTLLPVYRDLRLLAFLYFVQGVLLFVLGRTLLRKRHSELFQRPATIRIDIMKRMLTEAGPVFITRIGVWLTLELNLITAGYFLGPEQVPDYAILRQIILLGAAFSNAIPIAMTPYAAATFAAGKSDHMIQIYTKAVRYALVLAAVWAAGAIVWIPDGVSLWVGHGHFLGYAVLVPMVLNGFLEQQNSAHSFFVWTAGKWPFGTITIVNGILNVLFSALGCKWFAFTGLAWGTLAAQVMTGGWYSVYYPLRLFRIPLRLYLTRTLFPVVTLGSAILLVGIVARLMLLWHTPPDDSLDRLVSVAAGVLATTVVSAVAVWTILLTKESREEILNLIRRKRPSGSSTGT